MAINHLLSGSKMCHSSQQKKRTEVLLSGRRDSNTRPPVPQTVALPGCATSRPKKVIFGLPNDGEVENGCKGTAFF